MGGNVTVVAPAMVVVAIRILGVTVDAAFVDCVFAVDVLIAAIPIVGARLIASSVPQQDDVAPQHQVSVPGQRDILILPFASVSELYETLVDGKV